MREIRQEDWYVITGGEGLDGMRTMIFNELKHLLKGRRIRLSMEKPGERWSSNRNDLIRVVEYS